MNLSEPRWHAPVFRVAARTYTWLDVILAAMLRSDWRAFERRLQHGEGAAAEADRTNAWPDDDEIEQAANAFRYERDLLTSEETEAWLTKRDLDLTVWSEVLTRDVLRARWADRERELGDASGPVTDLDDRLVAAEGLCSGTFPVFARRLAEEAAVASTGEPHTGSADTTLGVESTTRAYAAWLDNLDPGDVAARLAHLSDVHARDTAAAQAALTPGALSAHLDRFRLEWTRIDMERLSFATLAAAREALACVRDDGMTLNEVAIEARQTVIDDRAVLEDVDASLRDAVLSAKPGSVVGPIDLGGRFVVAHVVSRTAASLTDAVVRASAERSVARAIRTTALLSHVEWMTADRP